MRQLTIMFESGMGISEIAIQLDRSEISVYQQLEKRGFLSAQSKPRNRIKKERTMARGAISESEALDLMARRDRKRKSYHNQYCKGKWGDSRSYDLCINSAKLGIQGTTDLLEQYIRARVHTARHVEE